MSAIIYRRDINGEGRAADWLVKVGGGSRGADWMPGVVFIVVLVLSGEHRCCPTASTLQRNKTCHLLTATFPTLLCVLKGPFRFPEKEPSDTLL